MAVKRSQRFIANGHIKTEKFWPASQLLSFYTLSRSFECNSHGWDAGIKGQLITERLFGVFNFQKKNRKNLKLTVHNCIKSKLENVLSTNYCDWSSQIIICTVCLFVYLPCPEHSLWGLSRTYQEGNVKISIEYR